MDRRHPYRFLIAGSLLATAAVAGGSAADLPIAEARWIAPGRDVVRALTTERGECLALPVEPAARRSVEIGRAAFRDPLLLGGVAARVGLACASCHRAGHDNPDFHFPGLTGAPGTTDTTSAVTSERRDDARFNPKIIPSLVTGEGRVTISRARDGALERFIHGLVVDEFDGVEPSPRVLAGLADYVRALRRGACAPADSSITAASRIDDAARALEAGAQSIEAGDPATARTMVASARSILGTIAVRLPAPVPPAASAEITALSLDMGRVGQAPTSAADLRALQGRLLALRGQSAEWQRLSLFDRDRLAEALRAP